MLTDHHLLSAPVVDDEGAINLAGGKGWFFGWNVAAGRGRKPEKMILGWRPSKHPNTTIRQYVISGLFIERGFETGQLSTNITKHVCRGNTPTRRSFEGGIATYIWLTLAE